MTPRQSSGIVAGSEQSGIATRKDRARRVHHADVRGRITNYSKEKLRDQSDRDQFDKVPAQSPIEKSYRDDYIAANQIRAITFADLLLLLLLVFRARAARRKHRPRLNHNGWRHGLRRWSVRGAHGYRHAEFTVCFSLVDAASGGNIGVIASNRNSYMPVC